MVPFYFGRPDRRLYGVHRPPVGKGLRSGVLLLYPSVEEYNPLHWAFRNLEAMLAKGGFDTMRFDYFGTGDSAGEPEARTLDGWADDTRAAQDELVDRTGVRRLTLVAMRLGAAVAARACARREGSGVRAHHLVLWDPVVLGRSYLEELAQLDRARNLHLLHGSRRRDPDEILGYRMSQAHRRELEALDLTREPPSGTRLSVVTPVLREGQDRLGVTCEIVAEEQGTQTQSAGDSAVLPSRILAAIAARVAEAS
jgi:pimeloyl-ACP methyl ester carboxylesterase